MIGGSYKMRVVITGGAGFIGSHLVEKFLANGHRVLVIDDLSTGSYANIRPFLTNTNFEFFQLDVRETFSFEVDLIVNLACPASPIHYQKDPIKTLTTSILGTLNCLQLAHEKGVRLVHASTSEVYGDPEISPQVETYLGSVNPIGPRACYDEGKRCAETAIYDYKRTHNIDARVVRIFNTYGPRMQRDDGRVVSNFIVSALEGNPITIYGNGAQTRSFCYVQDTVDAIYQISILEIAPRTPVNIGNPNEISMLTLAELVLKLTNSASTLDYLALPADDPKQRCPDIELAKELMAWEPKIDLIQGLNETINFFKTPN
jgi:UDP-glucuronate decarboxylase